MGTSPYRGHTAAHVLFTELAKVDICSRKTFLQTSITCWAGRLGPCATDHHHIHHCEWPDCGPCNMEYYGTGHAEARAASERKGSAQMRPATLPEAHYGFIAALNEALAVSHYKLQANVKLFKCVLDTRVITKHCACVPARATTTANDYSAISVPNARRWSASSSEEWAVIFSTFSEACSPTYWWAWGSLKAIGSSLPSDPLHPDRTWTSRWARGAALPSLTLRTLRTPVSNLTTPGQDAWLS